MRAALPWRVSLPPRVLTADRGDEGLRLDLVLRRHLQDLRGATRTRVQSWIERGLVTVNGVAGGGPPRRAPRCGHSPGPAPRGEPPAAGGAPRRAAGGGEREQP